MSYLGMIAIAALIIFLVGAMCWLDSKLPTAEQEKKRDEQERQEAMKRVNKETQERRRVRAGTHY